MAAERRRADVWLRRKGGRADSWYYKRTRLKTKNAVEARERARLVERGQWPPPEPAQVTAAAFALAPVPAPAPESPPGPPPPPPEPAPPAPEPVTGEWTHAAQGAAAESAPAPDGVPPPAPDEPSSEQLAELLVEGELKLAEIYIQQTVYEPFIAPEIAPENPGRRILVGAYKQMIDYGGAVIQLPPWVKGLVVPALTVVVSSMAIVGGFRDSALRQKASAGGT